MHVKAISRTIKCIQTPLVTSNPFRPPPLHAPFRRIAQWPPQISPLDLLPYKREYREPLPSLFPSLSASASAADCVAARGAPPPLSPLSGSPRRVLHCAHLAFARAPPEHHRHHEPNHAATSNLVVGIYIYFARHKQYRRTESNQNRYRYSLLLNLIYT